MRSPIVVRSLVHVAFVASLALPGIAHAEGDAAAGKAKSTACAACHVSSNPASDTPHLAGQRPAYIAKQLKAFQKGGRTNPFMNAIAKQLSDADIDNLAAFWSSQAAGSDTTPPPEAAAINKSHMAFPKDFPKGFTLYLTSNDAQKNAISKTYINAAGFAAAKAGKPLPDGTVIITIHEAAKLDANKKPVVDKDGSWAVEKIENYAGMESRAGWGQDIPELLRNGNWNYAVFSPKGDLLPSPPVPSQAACLGCHKPQAETGFLFSSKELQAKAQAK
jgi:cytochrome c553